MKKGERKNRIVSDSLILLLMVTILICFKMPVSANSSENVKQNQVTVEQSNEVSQVEALQGETFAIEDEETPLAPGMIGNDASQLNFWWWIFIVLVVSGTFCCVRMEKSEHYSRIHRP